MKKTIINLSIIIFLIIISFVVLNSKRTTNPYYFDEISWICEGRVWNELIQRNFKSGIWVEDLVQRLNPQLHKYILGWWMSLVYKDSGFMAFNCPGWGNLMHIKGLEQLNDEQQNVLFFMRIPTMFFGIISVIIFFLIGTLLFGQIFGLFGALFLLFNPLFQITVNRSMPDSTLLLWYLLFSTIILKLIKNNQLTYKNPFYSILFGLIIGFGTSIKTYGVYSLGFLLSIWSFYYFKAIFIEKKPFIKEGLLFIANSLLTFTTTIVTIYLLNPIFWFSFSSFLDWIPEWITFQSWLQKDDWAYKDIALFTPWSRLKHLFTTFIYPGIWNTRIGYQIFTLLALASGIFHLLFQIIKKGSNMINRLYLLFWFSINFLVLLFYTPFRLERYYAIFLPSLLMMEVFGLYQIFLFIKNLIKSKKT